MQLFESFGQIKIEVQEIIKAKERFLLLKAVGFDSIKLELGAFSTKFEGLLGVGITTVDEKSFEKKYIEVLKSLFESTGVACDRLVCKSVDIAKFIQTSENMIRFLESFFDGINDEIERIDIYCTRFNSEKIPNITIYGSDRPEHKKPIEFIRKIANGYPHICAWKYLSYFGDKDCVVYLDHFESDRTPAWDFLSNFSNIRVIYKGDSCNSLLSSSDLFIRLTTLLLKKNRAGFNWRGLKEIHSSYSWGTKTSANTLGGQTYILKNMAPFSRKAIDLSSFINHPIVFIPHESPGGMISKEEQRLFENMPIYEKLLNFLFHINGSFKYFSPMDDVRLIQEGDYILIMSERSESLLKYLNAGGVTIKRITLKEIEAKLKKYKKE